MLEEGSHQLINERADIRAALTALIPAFLHADSVHKIVPIEPRSSVLTPKHT